MMLSCLAVAIAAGFVTAAAYALVYIKKSGAPIRLPLALGAASLGLAYVAASLVMLAVESAFDAATGASFLEETGAYFYMELAAGASLALMMFLMLRGPLRERRSARESLAFGIGVAGLLLLYKAVNVVAANVECIRADVDYGTAALVLAEGTAGMALTLLEALAAVTLAHFLNRKRPWTGLVAALICAVVSGAADGAAEMFGLPRLVRYAVPLALIAALAVFVGRVWKEFPAVRLAAKKRRGAKEIQWPDPGEDGR